ncbi:MAG: acyl transferase, partial [Chitinophagaceae bacterium]
MSTNFEHIFTIKDDFAFEKAALATFYHQAENCKVYHQFIHHLGVNPQRIVSYREIPFLPIGFFKTHEVVSEAATPEIIFSSSGTTGQMQSKHLVNDVKIYEKSFNLAFEEFYGSIEDTCLL